MDELFEALSRITARATGEAGVSVEVNLDGMLIGLSLTEQAVRLGTAALAAEIFRLTHQASAAALAEGIDVVAPLAGPELAALLETREPEPEDDFPLVETWALPR
jgi:hypothetical protein